MQTFHVGDRVYLPFTRDVLAMTVTAVADDGTLTMVADGGGTVRVARVAHPSSDAIVKVFA
jgi:hypothetical protein